MLARESGRLNAPLPFAALFMAGTGTQQIRPLRPRCGGRTFLRRFRHDLNLKNTRSPLPQRRTDAIASGIAAADHHDPFPCGGNGNGRNLAADHPVLSLQEFQSKMNSGKFTAGQTQIARFRRSDRQDHGIGTPCKVIRRNILSDTRPTDKPDPGLFHPFDPPFDHAFLQFKIRNAVTEQSARCGMSFVNGYLISEPIQLIRGGESRRSGTDHSDASAVALFRNKRLHPAVLTGGFDYLFLDLADHYRLSVNAVGAGTFTERRADTAGEFRKTAGRRKDLPCFPPLSGGGRGVEFRNHIAERTPRSVTERNSAFHTAGRLFMEFGTRQLAFDFAEIPTALVNGTVNIMYSLYHSDFSLFLNSSHRDGRRLRRPRVPCVRAPDGIRPETL